MLKMNAGIAYNGVDEATGEVKWNGMANVKLRVYEGAHKFQHVSFQQCFKVECYNVMVFLLDLAHWFIQHQH